MESDSGFEAFCGGQLWNASLSWRTFPPQLTKCCHTTVLGWAAALFLFLAAPFEIRSYFRSPHRRIPRNAYNLLKAGLTLLLLLVALTSIVLLIANPDGRGDVVPAEYVTVGVFALSYALSLLLLALSLHFGVRTSPAQFFFYLISSVCCALNLTAVLRDDTDAGMLGNKMHILQGLQLAGVLANLLLNLFADARPLVYGLGIDKLVNPCPSISASFASRLVFAWVLPLLWRGFRQPLRQEDMWQLHPDLASRCLVPKFDAHLEGARRRAAKKRPAATSNGSLPTVAAPSSSSAAPNVTLFPSLCYAFGSPVLLGCVLKVVSDLLSLASPQIMKQIMAFVEVEEDAPDTAWHGFFYAAALLLAATGQSLFYAKSSELMYTTAMNIKTVLASTVYRKAMLLSGSARRSTTVGQIVNLMSVDVQKFMDVMPYLSFFGSAPILVGLCIYFLYQEVGPSAFLCIAVFMACIPINSVAAAISRRFQIRQMKHKDKRIKLMNEILGGMKVLKLYGWEPSFIQQVLDIRAMEIKVLKMIAWMGAITTFIWSNVPLFMTLATFAVYIFADGGNVLTAEKAFVTISYIELLRMTMMIVPFIIVGLVQVRVSLERLNTFINLDELDATAVGNDASEKDPIVIKDASFRWNSELPTVLWNINLRVERNSLTAVVGQVGSGKSSLMSTILGEMEVVSGSVNLNGQLAYVAQQAWIQNGSVKQNILFSKPEDRRVYDDVIEACALKPDFDILPAGDETEIGERGVNLSGGQKQRISLARAVFNDADVYLLDDPLSAVDSHVGKHIFDKVVGPTGLLCNKTRLLVTHGVTYLPKADHIVVLKDGRISEQGSFEELMARKGDFAEYLLEHLAEEKEDDSEDEETKRNLRQELEKNLGKEAFDRQSSMVSQRRERTLSVRESLKEEQSATDVLVEKKEDSSAPGGKAPNGDINGAKLIEKEKAQEGQVSWSVYLHYIQSVGFLSFLAATLLQIFYQVCYVATSIWMTVWTDESWGSAAEPSNRDMYLGVYGALGGAQSIASVIFSATLALAALSGSRKMHRDMLAQVLRSPMSFFDVTPLGRIVNRFAKDIDVCDSTLPFAVNQAITGIFNFVGTIFLILYVIPMFVVIILPLTIIFYCVQKVYIATARQLRRLESISRSPVYSHFGESLSGTSTIRAYGLQQRFIMENQHYVDKNNACYYPSIMTNRWLQIMLELLGNITTFGAVLFTTMQVEMIGPSQVGLVITNSIRIIMVLNFAVRMVADLEANIVAVERIKEYTLNIDSEADWEREETKPEKKWPQQGEVTFKNFSMRYREGLDLTLTNISVNIDGGQTVGIVGRTGAGKSSLTVALFRIIEAAAGQILIDGIDISKLGLHDLRKKLTIIPQDPVLFSGTLRINLDPFSLYSDEEIWSALELAHLKSFAISLKMGLNHEVSEGGENLSVGQRQLICLARALLRKSKVLILDEATAAIDLDTDNLIQATIRKEFQNCTVLTIAHRLNTILDYDKIMVLDKGHIKEFDSPESLLADSSSQFYSMAKDANLV